MKVGEVDMSRRWRSMIELSLNGWQSQEVIRPLQ